MEKKSIITKTKFFLFIMTILLSMNTMGQTWEVPGPYGWPSGNMTATLNNEGLLTINSEVSENMYNVFTFSGIGFAHPWYYVRSSIFSVVIGDKVTSIGANAFIDCANLTSVLISNSVTWINGSAFVSCNKLTDVTVGWMIPLAVSNDEFQGSNLSVCTLHVPVGTKALYEVAPVWKDFGTIIDDGKHENQTWFLSPTMTATLNNEGFLTVVTTKEAEAIPGQDPIYNPLPWYHVRSNILSIAIEPGITSIGDLYSIGMGAFMDCINLTSLTLSNSVKTIGMHAFARCSSLKNLTIANGVTAINSFAFSYCSSLANITIPKSVTSILDNVFANCTSLTDVTVEWTTPLPVWNITFDGVNLPAATLHVPAGTKALYKADPVWGLFGTILEEGSQIWQLTPSMTATLDNAGVLTISTTKVEGEAMPEKNFDFWKFPNIDTYPWVDVRQNILSVVIEDKVTCIGNGAFFACNNLTSISISNSVINIGYASFTLSGVTYVTIPNSVKSIGFGAFEGCSNLTSITIPTSVTTIETGAFSACTKLTSIWVDQGNPAYSSDSEGVLYNKDKTLLHTYPAGKNGAFTIPNSVTKIGRAFTLCVGLTSVIIPNSVNTIDDDVLLMLGGAFGGCTAMTDVTVNWTTPISINQEVFVDMTSNSMPSLNILSTKTLHVPADTKVLYEADPVWGYFGTIVEQAASTVAVTSVTLDKSSVTMWVAENEQLTATVLPANATNRNVIWSSSDTSVATVSASGLITAIAQGTTVITATSVDNPDIKATCVVTVQKQDVEAGGGSQTGDDGHGTFVLSLTIPADVLFSGSFALVLPDGVQLDLSVTHLADDLASKLILTVIQKADGSWIFTITPQILRSAAEMNYSQIVEIGYIIDEKATLETYEATIHDLSFAFDNGALITENEIPVIITAGNPAGIEDLRSSNLKAYVENGVLYVSGLTAGQTWHVYNIAGTLIHQGVATSIGEWFACPLPTHGVYIVSDKKTTLKVVN